MRILITEQRDMGLARALTACGHEVVFWDQMRKSAFDAFDEFNPDMYIGDVNTLTSSTVKCLMEKPNIKSVLKVYEGTDLDRLQHDVTFDLLYTDETLPYSADIFTACGGKADVRYACDISHVGNSSKEKLAIIGHLQDIRKQFRLKLFGEGWSGEHNCGKIDEQKKKVVVASSTINVAFGNEVVDVLAGGGFCMAFDPPAFLSANSCYRTSKAFIWNDIDCFLAKKHERNPFIVDGFKEVMDNHTCFNRIEKMFELLSLPNEAAKVVKTFTEVKKVMGL